VTQDTLQVAVQAGRGQYLAAQVVALTQNHPALLWQVKQILAAAGQVTIVGLMQDQTAAPVSSLFGMQFKRN
jgi:hypothetical protein